jgi:ABC-2 type transport system permease protein
MLADAFAAERLRLVKARGTVFWGFLFWPIVTLVTGIGTHLFFNNMARKAGAAALLAREPMDLGRQLLEALQGGGFAVALVFFVLAMVSIVGSDYRWETWRLLTPRNTRPMLILGKLACFAAALVAGLVLLMLAGVLQGLFGGLVNGHPIVLTATPNFGKLFAGLFTVAFLDAMWVAALAACITIATRSQIAGILMTLGVVVVEGVIMGQLPLLDPSNPPVKYLLLMPGLCANTVRNAVLTDPMVDVAANAPWALLILIGWVVLLCVLAVVLFRRQDLTRE